MGGSLGIIGVVGDACDVGREFVAALAAQDFGRMGECLAPDIQFRAVLPVASPFREETGGRETAELIGRWFGDADPLELLDSSVERLAESVRIAYRFAAFEEGKWHLVEQQGYVRVADGKIVKLDLVCSGFQPVSKRPTPTA